MLLFISVLLMFCVKENKLVMNAYNVICFLKDSVSFSFILLANGFVSVT